MINLEASGLGPNVYFSRAGRYDRAKKGTFGDDKTLTVLKALLSWGLPGKHQISAGFADIGHTGGKGGEHRNNAFDYGLSNHSPQEINQIRSVLKNKGLVEGQHYLYEGAGTSNNHLHFRPWTIAPMLQKQAPVNLPQNAFEPKLPPSLPPQATAPKINNPALEQQATQSLIDGKWFTPEQWDQFKQIDMSQKPKLLNMFGGH